MTSRSAGLGLVLVATLVIAGCSQSDPATPQAGPPAAEVAAPATPAPAAPAETPKPEAAPPQTPAEPKADGQKSPTPISAIGKAISGALGMKKDEEPPEAPAYQP